MIDEQRKTFTECISSIEQAVAQYDRRSADAALARLAYLAQAHFTLEESLIWIHDGPRLEDHADGHKQFSVYLRTLRERFLATNVFRDRIKFLQERRNTHVEQHDKSFALHFLKYAALGKS
jgi:hemerythrin-like metal-binding protein